MKLLTHTIMLFNIFNPDMDKDLNRYFEANLEIWQFGNSGRRDKSTLQPCMSCGQFSYETREIKYDKNSNYSPLLQAQNSVPFNSERSFSVINFLFFFVFDKWLSTFKSLFIWHLEVHFWLIKLKIERYLSSNKFETALLLN